MTLPPSGPVPSACPVCLHPLLIEVWSRADTFSSELIEEVVIVDPVTHRGTAVCPGCRTSVEAVAESYRRSVQSDGE